MKPSSNDRDKYRISNEIIDDMNKGKNMRSYFIEKEKLQEENEILKDKVKHLESLLNKLDKTSSNGLEYVNEDNPKEIEFSDNNHKTKRNENGNLITYYTK